MAEEEVDGKELPGPSQPPFLEVLCKSCGKVRRFASGTEAGFAVCLINSKLSIGAPSALYIEAAKDGEESICFGPKAPLFNYGEGWKLQTVIEEAMKEGCEAASEKIRKQVSSLMKRLSYRISETFRGLLCHCRLQSSMLTSRQSHGYCGKLCMCLRTFTENCDFFQWSDMFEDCAAQSD